MVNGDYERKISVQRIVLAFLLTTSIFIIGLFVGLSLTSERMTYLEGIAYTQRLDYNSLQLQELYLSVGVDNMSCTTIRHILDTSLTSVADAQSKIDTYMKDSKEDGYVNIKRDYTIAQIRYWLLNQKIKQSCNSEDVSILYFYSNDQCVECGAQGTILSYLKQKLGDRLLVFSIDNDFILEPMVGIIKQTYNITKVPSVVIGDKAFDRLMTKDQLLEQVCELYKEKPEICR